MWINIILGLFAVCIVMLSVAILFIFKSMEMLHPEITKAKKANKAAKALKLQTANAKRDKTKKKNKKFFYNSLD